MDKIKNVRAGILIIADAKLKLIPGQCVPVETLTPQMRSAIAAGLLAKIDGEPVAKPDVKGDLKADGKSKPRTGGRGTKATTPEPEPQVRTEPPTVDTPSGESGSETADAPQLELTTAGEGNAD